MSSVNEAGNNLDKIIDLICTDFELKMKYSPKPFICENDLKEVWENNYNNFEFLFSQLNWTNDSAMIRHDYVKILSFLIYTNQVKPSVGDDLKSLFFTPAFKDTEWPLREDQLPPNLGGRLKNSFMKKHSCFSPVVINEFGTPKIQVVEAHWRLPFLKISEIGSGGFGTVKEVTIAPRYLSHERDGTENNIAKVVACKTFKHENTRNADFQAELGILQQLKADPNQEGQRIMLHIASIMHGSEFMILLPLAEFRDLEIFLRFGYKPGLYGTGEETLVYDFDQTFPDLTPFKLRDEIFKELCQLAKALSWLHTEIADSNRYCAHLDLKPDNILIKQATTPIGRWMISDFGISIFDKETNNPQLPSMRQVVSSLTNRRGMVRGHGSYQPPEVDNPKVDGRKSDVWSFGCIVSESLTFSLGNTAKKGSLALKRFREDRSGADDFFYTIKRASRISFPFRNDPITHQLKDTISKWLKSLSSRPTYAWVKECAEILKKVLVIDPNSRLLTKDFKEALDRISSTITAERARHESSLGDFIPDVSPHEPLSPVSRAQSLESKSPIILNPPGKIKNISFSANGNRIACLFQDCVCVYAVDESEPEIEPIKLNVDIGWIDVCIADKYLAMYGIGESSDSSVLVSHINGIDPITTVPDSQGGGLVLGVIVSSKGQSAYVFHSQIILSPIGNGQERILKLVDKDSTIRGTAFGASGQWLCAWTTGGQNDQCYFWDTEGQEPPEIGYYEKVPTASQKFTLCPYGSAPACILREATHGVTFLAQSTRGRNPISRDVSPVYGGKHILTNCISDDDRFLICIEDLTFFRDSFKISAYPLTVGADGTRRIGRCSKSIVMKGKVNKDPMLSAIVPTEGNIDIQICAINKDKGENKEILRYSCRL